MKKDFSGKRVTVMGLGLFGGGVAAAQYFADRGAAVIVTDTRTREDLAESIDQIDGVNVSLRLGGHDTEDFTETDLVIANPAVPLDNPYLKAARDAGVPIDAELNLFFRACPAPIVGVTGSNGKSTTAALIAHLLESTGRTTYLGGNIGRSLLTDAERIAPHDVVVLEISSFQLEYLDRDRVSPHVAVVMNLRPNHLDRHKTMENYRAVKQHIVEHQSADDVAILNADDEAVLSMQEATAAQPVLFSMRAPVKEGTWLDGDTVHYRRGGQESLVGGLDRLQIPGRHNLQNVCAAVAAAAVMGVDPEAMREALASFQPLPHRQQKIAERAGVVHVDDSIATNPDSVAAALSCCEGNVVLIAGGSPKDIPYDAMVDPIVQKVKLLVLVGQTAVDIETAVRSVNSETPEIIQAGTLERAVEVAREHAVAGDVVLLSPGCASFDQFHNFRERGERFQELVAGIPD